jgi:hypothetical protein
LNTRPPQDTGLPKPSLLGLAPSFGFGDRLGLATPGHIQAALKGKLQPIFAQQSVREMTRTNRTPAEVMRAAQDGIQQERWSGAWGADADHLKTEEDVRNLAAAGFTFFTIDPSAFVENRADQIRGDALQSAADDVIKSGAFESIASAEAIYLTKSHELSTAKTLNFSKEDLLRALVKYGRAVAYSEKMAGWIRKYASAAGAEIEVSVDETDSPTSILEHLFIGLELKRRQVNPVSVAPRFIGEFEKGIDYKGDLREFEASLKDHVAVARYCGPYKISVHSGSDKFRIYPIVGRVCRNLLHVKTAGTSYLEALRVVARTAPALFTEIIEFSLARFEADRATYHISARLEDVAAPAGMASDERENIFLNQNSGRQILHVTFGSVLTAGKSANGRTFKDAINENLRAESDLHRQVLSEHLGRHITSLSAG